MSVWFGICRNSRRSISVRWSQKWQNSYSTSICRCILATSAYDFCRYLIHSSVLCHNYSVYSVCWKMRADHDISCDIVWQLRYRVTSAAATWQTSCDISSHDVLWHQPRRDISRDVLWHQPWCHVTSAAATWHQLWRRVTSVAMMSCDISRGVTSAAMSCDISNCDVVWHQLWCRWVRRILCILYPHYFMSSHDSAVKASYFYPGNLGLILNVRSRSVVNWWLNEYSLTSHLTHSLSRQSTCWYWQPINNQIIHNKTTTKD